MPHAPRKQGRALRIFAVFAVAFVLLLTVLDLPTTSYDIDRDLSSSASLEYFAARGIQFGTQLVQNVGPLGWIQYSAVYAGFLHPQKIVLGLLRAAALCVLLLWACTRFRGRVARIAWLLSIVALIPLYPIGAADLLAGVPRVVQARASDRLGVHRAGRHVRARA